MSQLTLTFQIPCNTLAWWSQIASLTFQSIVLTGETISCRKTAQLHQKWHFFSMISTLPFELLIGTSMVLSEIVMLVYYKVSEPSKPVGTCISPVNLSKYCANRGSVLLPNFGTKCTIWISKYMFQLTLTVLIPCNTLAWWSQVAPLTFQSIVLMRETISC